jgi:Endonuclease/Exonuclease/phosphatase family
MTRLLLFVAALLVPVATAASAAPSAQTETRFATFNASLNRSSAGLLVEHLSNPGVDDVFRRQARNVAEVVQRVRPDVLLINEFDFDPAAPQLFHDNFLQVSQNGAPPIKYRYSFIAPSNTGIPTGKDLDNNGTIGGGNDAFGFGAFPGQFGMVVYSKHPILADDVRTFQLFRWKDMPGNLIPTPFYSPDEVDILRLSSKSHWDIPVKIDKKVVHFLVSHPTPPVFDGPEDRNGRRNFDEIRFWADYISPGKSGYIYDDQGKSGGLKPGALFVIAGDQNSDPLDGDSIPGSIQQLLEHPLVNTRTTPDSAGAVEATALQGGANASHRSDPRFDTADFSDTAPGNLRADYVLPRKNLRIVDAGVFWPVQSSPLFRLTGVFDFAQWGPVGGFPTSDHRSVWIDVR